MELKEISKENLQEAQKLFEAEVAKEQTVFALEQLRSAHAQKVRLQKEIKNLSERVEELDEMLAPFKHVKKK